MSIVESSKNFEKMSGFVVVDRALQAELLELLPVGQRLGRRDLHLVVELRIFPRQQRVAELAQPLGERLAVLALAQRHGRDDLTHAGVGRDFGPRVQVALGLALPFETALRSPR